MKKLLAIVVLGLFMSSNVKSNELTGIKLECNFNDVLFRYFEFKSSEKVHTWIGTNNSEPNKGYVQYYNEGIRFIKIYPTKEKVEDISSSLTLDRETLILIEKNLKYSCKKLDIKDIQKYLEENFKKNSEIQKQKNKI